MPAPARGAVKAEAATLIAPGFTVQIDERTGAIASLFSRSLKQELVDAKAATALNDYFYLPGSDLKGLQRNGPPRITREGDAARWWRRCSSSPTPRAASGSRAKCAWWTAWTASRSSTPWTSCRCAPRKASTSASASTCRTAPCAWTWAGRWCGPKLDQIPAACKNWFSVQRWVDISNDRFGVTWSPVDAPLVEVGGITANLIGSQTDPEVWIQHLEPSQTIYSWVMNNHWHTNYRAEQEGPTVFRYAIRPHKGFAPEDAARFGVACSQPLIVAPASGSGARRSRASQLSSDKVVVTAFKPSDDGKAWIVRLFGASGKTEKVKLAWAKPAPQAGLAQRHQRAAAREGGRFAVEVPGWGIVTLRAE